MKADAVEDNPDNLTPKKKLKQARLPFKVIGDAASVTESPVSRKRKLAVEDPKIENKIGRTSKKNGITNLDESIVISDDEKALELENKPANPLVKIIDKARKNKFQKLITSKKRRSKRLTRTTTSPKCNGSVDSEIEKMDVDASEETECVVNNEELSFAESKKQVRNEVIGEEHMEVIILDDESNSTHASLKSDEVQQTPDHPNTPLTTHKRLRSSTKSLNSDLDNTAGSNLDESSTNSLASTPKSSREIANTKLTPKQLQKRQEAAKKREERDKKKQEEKDEKARIKQEKEDQKKREREEKEEQRRKEKEEKEKQKELEKKLREEKEESKRKEKEEKEEQRRKEKEEKEDQKRKEKEAKEEERRKKQEALDSEKQEQELKKKKAAEAFVNFFVPKQKVDKDTPSTGPISKNSILSSFTIKSDMRLAPTVRNQLDEERRENLDLLIENQKEDKLYLKCLKEGLVTPGCCGKTWPLDDKDDDDDDDDVVLIEDDLPSLEGMGEVISSESVVREKLRPKLFSFQENRRPPYWGTWRKKSIHIKPRKPFGKDEKVLDYEVDSDEEWEDEGEGESVDDDGSDEEAEGDEYEVDNEFFVPHGYLSDEEATMDGDDVLSLSPEAQKAKLKHLEDEFELEMKKPTEKLKPRLYGLLWATKDGGKPDNCVDVLWNYFDKLSMIMDDPTSLLQPSQENEEVEKKKIRKKKSGLNAEQSSPNSEKKKKQKVEKNEIKKTKSEIKKPQKSHNDSLKNQPGINSFLKKLKAT